MEGARQMLENVHGAVRRTVDRVITASPVRFFVIGASVFGLAFILITPPLQGADETAHFFRAYSIASGQIKLQPINNNTGAGAVLPASLGQTENLVNSPSISFQANEKYRVGHTLDALRLHQTADKATYVLTNTAVYAPISYIPSAVAIFIGKLLRLPPVLLLYGARLAGLITWIILIGVAIRLMPVKKWVLVFIGLLPMALFQAGTVNTDVMAIGTVFVFCSYIFRLVYLKKVLDLRRHLTIIILGILMALSKQVQFIFLPVSLLLADKQFATRKINTYGWRLLYMLVPLIAVLGAYIFSTHGLNLAASYSNGADPARQISFVLHSPESFINVLWNTYFYSWGDGITGSLIGTFGWFDAPLAEGIVVAAYCVCFLLIAASYGLRSDKPFLSGKQKLLLGVVGLAYIAAVSGSLYSFYTPIGFKVVVGLQGRYFIPVLILLGPLFLGAWLKASRRGYLKIATIAPIVLLLCSTITLYVRYYVHNY